MPCFSGERSPCTQTQMWENPVTAGQPAWGSWHAGKKPGRVEPGHQEGSVPIINVQTDFPLPCQVRPQKNSSNHINKNRCFSEDTNNTMASLYSCFLATATSTAQQNATSSPSEDNPQADLGGLWDRAVIALGWESSPPFSLSIYCACRWPSPGPGMAHLGVMAFSGKEPFLAVGPEAPSISECSGNEAKSYILWIFVFLSWALWVCQPVRWPQSCPDILPFVPNDLYSFAESLAGVS